MADEITISSNWNGVVYTAHATDGTKFGTAVAGTDEEARAGAVKDLKATGATEPPVQGGGHTTAAADAEQEAAKAAGRTGDKAK